MARSSSTEWNNGSRASRLQADARGVPANIMMPRILLIISALALLLIGLVMVFSASSVEAINDGGGFADEFKKQCLIAVSGIVLCACFAKFATIHFLRHAGMWIAFIVSLILLGVVWLFGTEDLGATRWIVIAGFTLQPSEFAKIAFILMAAKILVDYREELADWKRTIVFVGAFVVLPLLFMYKSQSDMGTTLITAVGILAVMWLGEVPLRYVLALIAAGVLLVVVGSLTGYRADRIGVWLNPWSDEFGTGFQAIHSFYAFAEGGLFGVGLGNSREKFLYLPEAETDFIFSIIGEELGLVGTLLVIGLFLVFLYAGLRIAHECPDTFGCVIAGGFTVMIVFQAFLNIACTIGVFPVTGKPLPFISSGGSSMWSTLIMVGIILAVSVNSNVLTESEQRRNNLTVIRGGRSDSAGGARSERRSHGGAASSGRTRSVSVDTSRSDARSNRSAARSRSAGRTDGRTGSIRPGASERARSDCSRADRSHADRTREGRRQDGVPSDSRAGSSRPYTSSARDSGRTSSRSSERAGERSSRRGGASSSSRRSMR